MKKLIDIIAEACDNKIVRKNLDIDLFETGLLDSMAFIMMLVKIEEEYMIEIDPKDVKKNVFNTPRAIIKYVEEHK